MITRDDGRPAVLTFGEALVGYATVEESLRVGTQFTRFPGGADLNVAVGLTRLGTSATWASVLGEDAHGDYLADVIGDLGVEVVLTRAAGPTALMFKAGGADSDPEVLQVRTATAFAAHAADVLSHDLLAFDGLDHLHLTGITQGISEAACATAFALLEAARSHGLTVSFDPNLRLNLWPDQDKMRGLINTAASQATIVLPGLGEGALLTARREPEAIADFYLSAGAGEVVVKLGRDGAKAWDGHGAATSIPYFVESVDTVGAGDGFAAGYLDAALGALDLQGRVDQAAAVGALVTTRRGDLSAMPTSAELASFLDAQRGLQKGTTQ
jgi:2-dehydro-3-deoxygluconokinase